MDKEQVKEMVMIIRLREFVARKSLDREEDMGENEKMILAKLFANREYIAFTVRLNRELERDDEVELYKALLKGFDLQLRFYLSHLFKGREERIDNCVKRINFTMDETVDIFVDFTKKYEDDEYSDKVKEYFFEKYGEMPY
jgi:hypothetical protein